ncbi:MAG: hypothetical protein IPK29_04585 [Betaproteobacteria bacterium]|nr:hypothetical protein [Betaproteobacteria bacterium]
MQRHPSVTRQFIQVLTSRLVNRAPRGQEKLSTLALVPACGPAQAAAFALALETTLRGMLSAQRIDRAGVEARFPGALQRLDGAAGPDAALGAWLTIRSSSTARCCMSATRSPTPDSACACARPTACWSSRRPMPNPHSPGEVERLLHADANTGSSRDADLRGSELVLLHPSSCTQPAHTARWLASRRLRRHHHLREGAAQDMQRRCRHLLAAWSAWRWAGAAPGPLPKSARCARWPRPGSRWT